MITRYLTACFFLILCSHALGWVIVEPVDHAKQLEAADFAGIVEVVDAVETGKTKALWKDGVAFREIRLSLRILSTFKGKKPERITCSIYREPTREELIADGVKEKDLNLVLLNLGVDEVLHLLPARAKIKDRLLVYLKSDPDGFAPVSGALDSSRSMLQIEPSNMVNTLSENKRAEQDGAEQPATAPESKPEGEEKLKPESEGRSQ